MIDLDEHSAKLPKITISYHPRCKEALKKILKFVVAKKFKDDVVIKFK